jgi:hypothetical protein
LCSQWSPLMLHLLFFSMCQLIVVMGNLDTHLLGTPANNGIHYTWYWYLQDLFHGAGGVTVLVLIFTCGGFVTYCFREIIPVVLQKAERCGATETQRLCLTVALNEELQGFYIFYLQFNLDVAVNFIWALICTFWAATMIVLQDQFVWHDSSSWNGLPNCPCLTASEVVERIGSNASAAGVHVTMADGAKFLYPPDYGAGCRRHDIRLPPYCNATVDAPDYCMNDWCYVDQCSADSEPIRSPYFDGMSFSSVTCLVSTDSVMSNAEGLRARGR